MDAVEQVCERILYDNGAFSFWQQALRRGEEWDGANRDWSPYYAWLEERLRPGRLAIIPDVPGAPTQFSDPLLNDWPFGRTYGVPVWHMNGPLERLGRLCERFDTVALGWIGHPKLEPVGCPSYRERMDEVAHFFGNIWPDTHMLRGVAVAWDYPFRRADSTSAAQNGHRYDSPLDTLSGEPWRGRNAYADALERHPDTGGFRGRRARHLGPARGRHGPSGAGRRGDDATDQPWLW